MEERIARLESDVARLESDVAHLQTHMADVKAEIRALRERFDEKLQALRERRAPPGLRSRG
jgi:predicted  nucleic acid-binding Zn-ribbon protein